MIGLALMVASTVVHASKFLSSCLTNLMTVVLPYADLVLFTISSSLAVVFGVFLAIVMLNEKFVCRYDLTAMILILIGSGLIVLQSNFSEYSYTAEQVKQLLIGYKALGFLLISFCIFSVTCFNFKK